VPRMQSVNQELIMPESYVSFFIPCFPIVSFYKIETMGKQGIKNET